MNIVEIKQVNKSTSSSGRWAVHVVEKIKDRTGVDRLQNSTLFFWRKSEALAVKAGDPLA